MPHLHIVLSSTSGSPQSPGNVSTPGVIGFFIQGLETGLGSPISLSGSLWWNMLIVSSSRCS